jgi:hypothetical protein
VTKLGLGFTDDIMDLSGVKVFSSQNCGVPLYYERPVALKVVINGERQGRLFEPGSYCMYTMSLAMGEWELGINHQRCHMAVVRRQQIQDFRFGPEIGPNTNPGAKKYPPRKK